MPDEVFEIVTNAYQQGMFIASQDRLSDIVHRLPIELRIKVTKQIVNHIEREDMTFHDEVDSIYYV